MEDLIWFEESPLMKFGIYNEQPFFLDTVIDEPLIKKPLKTDVWLLEPACSSALDDLDNLLDLGKFSTTGSSNLSSKGVSSRFV